MAVVDGEGGDGFGGGCQVVRWGARGLPAKPNRDVNTQHFSGGFNGFPSRRVTLVHDSTFKGTCSNSG